MLRLIMGISCAVALPLISGAAELARGGNLSPIEGNLVAGSRAPVTQGISLFSGGSREGRSSVNRTSKADRAAAPVRSPASTRTVSLKLDGFTDTTFLVRIPVAIANPAAAPAPATKPAAIEKPMVACEPMVSILTEVAKRLAPGRCVT